MTDKYGFVYIWFDRAKKKYYIGSHWGAEDDGYICSSTWMNRAYKRRPTDFKRRVVAYVHTTREDLLNEEQRWLNMIRPNEFAGRYYNINKTALKPWFVHPETAKTVGQKISASKMGKPAMWKDPDERGRRISEGKKRKFAELAAETGSAFTEEHRSKLSESHKGKKQSEESQRKRSESLKRAWAEGNRPRKEPKAKRFYTITPTVGQPFEVTDLKAYAASIGAPYVTLSKAAQTGSRSPKNGIELIERSWAA